MLTPEPTTDGSAVRSAIADPITGPYAALQLVPADAEIVPLAVAPSDDTRLTLELCPGGIVPAVPLPGGSSVTLVVPAMNEEANIPWVFERIPACVTEVLLVDGFSTDNTIDAALRCRPSTRVLRQHARGKGSALRTGFAAATCDYIVMIDADGSMDPSEIETFLLALDNGYDFVKGSRYLPGGGSQDITKLRNVGNFALRSSVNMLFLVPFTDLCYGYVAFRRSCLEQLCLTSHGFEIETEMAIHAVKAELRIAEVASNELCRRHGVSNLNTFRDGKRVLRTLVRERVSRRRRPVVDWLQAPPRRVVPTAEVLRANLLETASHNPSIDLPSVSS